MQIPKKLKVGGLRYDIRVCTEDELPDVAGDFTSNKKLIRLLKADNDYMCVTLLHEILHAMNMEMPEERIEFLAQGLYQVIADNPILFKEELPPKKRGVRHGRTKK